MVLAQDRCEAVTNPIRWFLERLVYFYLWWTREAKKYRLAKPNIEPRCSRGHLMRRRENGKWVSDHSHYCQ